MGTSVSFRSPATPRWHAFRASLESAEPIERSRAELFSAGASWGEEIASENLAPFVRRLIGAYSEFGDMLAVSTRPEQAISRLVREARNEALAAGAPAALAIAERALQQTLIITVRSTQPLACTSPEAAAATWHEQRGSSAADLTSRYLGEVVRQFALFATSREAAVVFGQSEDAGRTRQVTRELGRSVAALASDVEINDAALRESPDSAWRSAVQSVFSRGRAWPDKRQ